MRRRSILACVVLLLTISSLVNAQADAPPPGQMPKDLAQLPAEIKNLQWQSIDLNTVQPLEYDRALLLMNHVLDEIAPVRASEADLMSAYIQAQNLGPDFAKMAPPAAAKHLSFTDATKIAVALLRGPMAGSSYATQLSGSTPEGLTAYQQMYEGTCQRRWGEITESLQQVRCMSAFIQKQGKIKDYEAWAKLESENRQLKYQLAQDQKRSAEQRAQAQAESAAQKAAAQQAMLDRENQQLRDALASAQQQMQHQSAQIQQQQQQQQPIPENQMTPEQLQQQANALSAGYYGGAYPAYGAYYAPTYYGAGASWCYDSAAANESRAATEQRVAGWHGAPGANGGHGGGGAGPGYRR